MIDDTDAEVLAWARAAAPDLPVALVPAPGPGDGPAGVAVYLLEVTPRPYGRGGSVEPPPATLELRYLVTAWAADAAAAHRALGLLFDAPLPGTGAEVEQRPLPAETWRALGVPPQPALVLRVPVRREAPARPYQPVLGPMKVRTVERVRVHGRVLGPADTPLTGARVLIPAHRLMTETDRRGDFVFAAVPTDPPPAEVVVEVKGRRTAVPLAADFATEPVVVRLSPPEG